jgi:hypothetical protein
MSFWNDLLRKDGVISSTPGARREACAVAAPALHQFSVTIRE